MGLGIQAYGISHAKPEYESLFSQAIADGQAMFLPLLVVMLLLLILVFCRKSFDSNNLPKVWI